jgi:hypothetical protein
MDENTPPNKKRKIAGQDLMLGQPSAAYDRAWQLVFVHGRLFNDRPARCSFYLVCRYWSDLFRRYITKQERILAAQAGLQNHAVVRKNYHFNCDCPTLAETLADENFLDRSLHNRIRTDSCFPCPGATDQPQPHFDPLQFGNHHSDGYPVFIARCHFCNVWPKWVGSDESGCTDRVCLECLNQGLHNYIDEFQGTYRWDQDAEGGQGLWLRV